MSNNKLIVTRKEFSQFWDKKGKFCLIIVAVKVFTCTSEFSPNTMSEFLLFTGNADSPVDLSALEVDVVILTFNIVAEVVLVADFLPEEEDVAKELCSVCTPSLVSQYLFTCSFSMTWNRNTNVPCKILHKYDIYTAMNANRCFAKKYRVLCVVNYILKHTYWVFNINSCPNLKFK